MNILKKISGWAFTGISYLGVIWVSFIHYLEKIVLIGAVISTAMGIYKHLLEIRKSKLDLAHKENVLEEDEYKEEQRRKKEDK